MEKLTYSLIYSPEVITNYDAKYICNDGKIHIRFKDYDKPQVIKGFESKLTYLITYLFHKSSSNNIEDFMKLDEFWLLNEYLSSGISKYTNYKYKGLKLLFNYNKREETNKFGEINLNCFPNSHQLKTNNLDIFMNTLKITDLINFLFDDGYQIIIHKKQDLKENKFVKKQRKMKEKDFGLIVLW